MSVKSESNATPRVTIIGLGYVGLPLAKQFCKMGMTVVGFDTDSSKLEAVNNRKTEQLNVSEEDIGEMFAAGFSVTGDQSCLAVSDLIIVAVPTPVDENRAPNLAAVRGAAESLATQVTNQALVVLESTVAPGTTENTFLKIIESKGKRHGRDFYLAFSPERIDPGRENPQLTEIPKVMAGLDSLALERAVELYEKDGFSLIPTTRVRDAEASKLIENTYRAMNIALVNELAPALSEISVDPHNAFSLAATKPFGYHPFYPSAGAGGHCIAVDPFYLLSSFRDVGSSTPLLQTLESSSEVSRNALTARIIEAVAARPVEATTELSVLLLGMTYKEDVGDFRHSPGLLLARSLIAKGLTVYYHDPFLTDPVPGLPAHHVRNLGQQTMNEFGAIVVVQMHEEYKALTAGSETTQLFSAAPTTGSIRGIWE